MLFISFSSPDSSDLNQMNDYEYLSRKKHVLFSIDLIITMVYEQSQRLSPKYHVFGLFFYHIIFGYFSNILRCLGKLLYLGSIGNMFSPLNGISKIKSVCCCFLLMFSIKKPNNNKKQSQITCSIFRIMTIMFNILPLLLICPFKTMDELNQHIKPITMYFNRANNSPIVPQFGLNDLENWGVGLTCESESITQGRSYVDKTISISDCYFSRASQYSGSGGVIYVNGGTYTMNANYSMFYNCACSSEGGAIFFSSANSNLRMICANRCSCGAGLLFGQFSYFRSSLENQVEYLSISNCSHATSGYFSVYICYGNQKVYNTNSSMNNAYRGSGICIDYPMSFTSSHCAFSNNKVSEGICIHFCSNSGTITMSYANIVHNNSPSRGVVYVERSGSRKMMYCIFTKNSNFLFCVWESSLEVSHSFIDHSSISFSTSTTFITTNISLINRITFQMQFFNSLHCNADIPLVESKQKNTHYQTQMNSFNAIYQVIILMIS